MCLCESTDSCRAVTRGGDLLAWIVCIVSLNACVCVCVCVCVCESTDSCCAVTRGGDLLVWIVCFCEIERYHLCLCE